MVWPLAGGFRGVEARREEPVDAADPFAVRLLAEVILDLDFVSAA